MDHIKTFFLTEPAWKIFVIAIFFPVAGMWLSLTLKDKAFALAQMSFLAKESIELLWIYSIANYITKKYSPHINVPVERLYLSLIVAFLSFILFLADIFPTGIKEIAAYVNLGVRLYSVYFIARLVVMVEMKRKVTINDYLPTALLAYFWFIGIWFIQPRIHQIYREKY